MNEYQYKVQGVDYEVEIEEVEGNIAKVNVNGIPFEVELQQPINAAKHPSVVKRPTPQPIPAGQGEDSPATETKAQANNAAPSQGGTGNAVKAPLPGTVTDVCVAVGQKVNVGETILVLEAMKMQNNIEAEYAGTVTAINVNKGDTVMEGTVLMTIG